MSAATLRFHQFTLSFLPTRRERQIDAFARTIRVRVSRRHLKRILRNLYHPSAQMNPIKAV